MQQRALTLALVAALSAGGFAAAAAAKDLPKALAWSAYDVGSAGYNQAVAIGAAVKNHMGISLRVLPGKNDVSRLAPLKAGQVQFSAFGIGGYQASEAAFVFGRKEWGPQQLRMLSMSNSDACNTLMMAGDLNMKGFADLKGKRLPKVKGGPALDHNVYAYLRFAGLDWKDVKVVEFGGYGAAMDAVVEGNVDGGITITSSGFATKIVSGPRGHQYLPLPHNDEAGWKRMLEVAPYFFKTMCKEGAGLNKPETHFQAGSYPYPILIAYASQDKEMTYLMTKAMFDMFPHYKDSAPGASGWSLERQVFEWVVPYHDGAIQYYKERGVWTAPHQANQDRLLAREKVLIDAWKSYAAKAPGDEKEFEAGWMKARLAALEKANLPPVWREWQ